MTVVKQKLSGSRSPFSSVRTAKPGYVLNKDGAVPILFKAARSLHAVSEPIRIRIPVPDLLGPVLLSQVRRRTCSMT